MLQQQKLWRFRIFLRPDEMTELGRPNKVFQYAIKNLCIEHLEMLFFISSKLFLEFLFLKSVSYLIRFLFQ